MKCSQCEDGQMEIKSSTFGESTVSISHITCIICKGTGEMTKADHDRIEFENNMWCECDEPSDYVDFYGDGEHPEIHKHHYRCKKCSKVLQIG
jgi:hypothetical protein